MAAKEFIVAIELGSTKITGIAGRKNLDGSLTVLAVVKEDSTACIRKGIVYNIDKTALCLTNVINKLKNTLHTEIAQVYVGMGGQSIRSIRNVIVKDLPEETIVTQDMINELMDSNRNMEYPEQEIIDVATQEYKVDAQYQVDPVGIPCSRLEGNFLNILWRKTFYRNLNTCFENAGVTIAELYPAPLGLADCVLTESEKRTGCALVDFGADTTTVSIYYKNILRHLAVIPLGSNNITKDITSLQVEETEAEVMKLKYGKAINEYMNNETTIQLPVNAERSVNANDFGYVVEARTKEIIDNVWYQVPRELRDKLLGGVILTGGGANMPGIEQAFRNYTNIEKVRVAKFITSTVNSNHTDITEHTGMMNTALGLLAKGDINCAGEEIDPNANLFDAPKSNSAGIAAAGRNPYANATMASDAGNGKLRADEARRKREEEREALLAEEEEERLKAEEKKQNSFWNKFVKGAKKFGEQILKEEE